MRRIATPTILVVALVLAPSSLVAEGGSRQRGAVARHCRTSDGNGWSTTDVRQAIRCASGRWRPPGGTSKAISVARCESSFRPSARNACCSGVYQQHRSYWDSRRRQYNPHHGWRLGPSVYNARTNVVISIRMADHTGWGDWSCA